jgi:hypothetical protein
MLKYIYLFHHIRRNIVRIIFSPNTSRETEVHYILLCSATSSAVHNVVIHWNIRFCEYQEESNV